MNGNMNLGKRVTALEKDGGAEIKKEISDLQASVSTVQEEITNLESKVNSGHVYSTEEKVVGKWIDGKPLHEKTFISDVNTSSAFTTLATITDLNIAEICHEKANWKSSDGYWYEGNKVDGSFYFLYKCSADNIQYSTSGMDMVSIAVTIEYTKTTQ